MKKNNNNYRSDRTGELTRENPIHCYSGKETITGRVYGTCRRFPRPDGSSQYLFKLAGPEGPDQSGRLQLTTLELYVSADRDPDEVRRVLRNGRMLTLDFCRRYDVYIDRDGKLAERGFLFVSGPEHIRTLDDTAATA